MCIRDSFLALLRKVILLIPLALVLPRFLGTFGIFLAEPIADITAASVTFLMFLRFSRKLFRELEAKPQSEA